MRAGVLKNVDQWGWTIGFYPESHRGLRDHQARRKRCPLTLFSGSIRRNEFLSYFAALEFRAAA
jgi:hypothetical protein